MAFALLLGATLGQAQRVNPLDLTPTVQPNLGAPPPEAAAALGRGQALLREQRVQEGLGEFERALAISPDYADAWKWKAFAQVQLGKWEEAVMALIQALKFAPDDDYASRTLKVLVYRPGYMLWVDDDFINLGPTRFDCFPVHLRPVEGGATKTVAVACTTSVIYPDQQKVPLVEARTGASFNRVIYGYVFDAEAHRYEQKFALYYPSKYLSELGQDYTLRARQAATLLIALTAMATEYTGRDPGASAPFHVWLCEDGRAGGEHIANDLYFYEMERPRDDLEWFREVAHEAGHLMLPAVDGFTAPEAWANGILGELLFSRWLLLSESSGTITPIADTQQAETPGPENTPAEDESVEVEPKAIPRSLAYWWRSLDLTGLYKQRYDKLLAGYMEAGPTSPLAKATDASGFDYWLGMALYTEGALGTRGFALASKHLIGYTVDYFKSALADSIKRLPGNNFKIAPGFFNAAYREGTAGGALAITRGESCELPVGIGRSYYLYLTAEGWGCGLKLSCPAEGELGVSLAPLEQGQSAVERHAAVAAGQSQDVRLDLGQVKAGWYVLSVTLAKGAQPGRLEGITLFKLGGQ